MGNSIKKTILITGGSRGIGKATTLKFLDEGWNVITTSTRDSIDYNHENLTYIKTDVTSKEDVSKLASEVGIIDVLINNAGTAGDFTENPIDIKNLRTVLEVNLFGTIRVSEKLVDKFNDNGMIINVSSGMAALDTEELPEGMPSYRISKTAINMYTRTLAERLQSTRIKVCSYEPGWVKTDMGGIEAPREVEEPANELFNLVKNGFDSGEFYGPEGKRSW